MSKRTWGIGVMKVIKREGKQAIALALGGKCQKGEVADSPKIKVMHSKPVGAPVETR
jgi:hypothetical protein